MSQINKVNVKKTTKTVDTSIQRNLSSTFSYSNIQAADVSKTASRTESGGWLEDIANFFGFGDSAVDSGYDLLRENDIWYQKEDIKSVEKRGANSENILVKMNNGEEFLFIPDGDGFVLSSVKMSDGTKIYCNLSESEQQKIKNNCGNLKDDAVIKGYATIDVNGQSVKVYWVDGEASSFEWFKESLEAAKESLSNYPSNVLEEILSTDFKGIYAGPKESQTFDPDDSWAAYAWSDDYIYVDILNKTTSDTIEHELAHVLDAGLKNGNGYYSESNYQINSLYGKYKTTIQTISTGGYPSALFPDGLPDVKEFFAKAVTQYLECPDDLQSLMPDLYEYLNVLLNDM